MPTLMNRRTDTRFRPDLGSWLAMLPLLMLLLVPSAGQASSRDEMLLRGKHLYGESCVACHGPQGVGERGRTIGFGPGRAADVQRGAGPPLAGVGELAADFYLRTGYMPLDRVGQQPRRTKHLRFSDADIRALVAYVGSLGRGPAIPTPNPSAGSLPEGRSLFAQHCAGCHQVVARGGYVSSAVAPPLSDATATQIAEAVRVGPYVMPGFPKGQISDQQLDSIVRYVQFTREPDNRGGWALDNVGPIPEGMVAWFVGGSVLVLTCVIIGAPMRRTRRR
ncbi:MAG: c-type cytochrome [Thermoleophilia bacterium]